MMKSKKAVVILLVSVLGIWGFIGYKIIVAFSNKEPKAIESYIPLLKGGNIEGVKKTVFDITIPERDPFLGKIATTKVSPRKTKKKSIPKQAKRWPNVVYKGKVSDRNSKTSVFLIEINGIAHFAKEGKKLTDDIQFVKERNQKITLSFEKETKIFELTKDAFSY